LNLATINFHIKNITTGILFVVLACSCGDDGDTLSPKPKGYFRIDLPENEYQNYDASCPFSFDYSTQAEIGLNSMHAQQPCWLDINYKKFNGTIHLSYKKVEGNIATFLEDSRTLVTRHQIKASAIEEQVIMNDSAKVYGLIYSIRGNTASSLQFYLTDSTTHFLRGALYFNSIPNSDSIAPVLEFVREDVYRMVKTFHWK